MNSIKLIVFDFDHTIGHFNSGIERVVDVLHIREEALAILNGILNLIDKDKKEKLLTAIGDTERIDEFEPNDDVVSFIKGLDNGYTLAISSSNSKKVIQGVLDRLGLLDKFALIVSGEDVEHLKPAPDGIIKILDELGIDKEYAIFLGDSELDKKACDSAGIKFVLSLDELKERLKIKEVKNDK